MTKICERILKVQRSRIVDLRRYPSILEMRAQRLPVPDAHRELVVDVGKSRWRSRRRHQSFQPELVNEIAIAVCISSPGGSPVLEMAKLDSQDRSLERVESAIHSEQLVVILVSRA